MHLISKSFVFICHKCYLVTFPVRFLNNGFASFLPCVAFFEPSFNRSSRSTDVIVFSFAFHFVVSVSFSFKTFVNTGFTVEGWLFVLDCTVCFFTVSTGLIAWSVVSDDDSALLLEITPFIFSSFSIFSTAFFETSFSRVSFLFSRCKFLIKFRTLALCRSDSSCRARSTLVSPIN